MPSSLRLVAALIALCLALISPVQAQGTGTDLEVFLKREVSDWRLEGGDRVETRLNRLGLQVSDHVTGGLWIGIHGGYVGMSQSGNPATQGMDLGGWFLGTSGRWGFLEAGPVALSLLGHYTYNDVDATLDDQRTRYSWHHYGAGLESAFRLGAVRLRLGVDYSAVDGDEKASGSIQRTLSLSEDEAVTGRAALDLFVDPTGWISFQMESGGRRGAGIWFARRF
jgi:hypothetical protein